MRHYFIDENDKEYVFSGTSVKWVPNLKAYACSYLQADGEAIELYVRRSAGKLFVSQDGTSWSYAGPGKVATNLVCTNLALKYFRGFKPSGAFGQGEGELKTKMPGKVVKILVTENQEVNPGETLVIIEAMKMETK